MLTGTSRFFRLGEAAGFLYAVEKAAGLCYTDKNHIQVKERLYGFPGSSEIRSRLV